MRSGSHLPILSPYYYGSYPRVGTQLKADHTIAFDDSLVMRFARCIKCLGDVYWIDLVELDGLPRCVGLCQRCLDAMRRQSPRADAVMRE